MLQLDNQTPLVAALMLFPNKDAVDTVYVVLKATFDLSSKGDLAKELQPIALGDEHFGDPVKTSLKYPNEAQLEMESVWLR